MESIGFGFAVGDAVDVAALVERLDRATDPGQMLKAVQALAETGATAAIPHLIRAFGFNRPGVADQALEGLVRLGAAAVDPLLSSVDGYDYGARAYSVRALARIGDPRAFGFLVDATRDFAPSVKRAAVRGLGRVAGDPDQRLQALGVLSESLQDPDWGIRYAALCALADLQAAEVSVESLLQQAMTGDPDALIRVKARAVLEPASSEASA